MAIDFYKAKVDKVLMFFLVASFNFYQIVGVDLKVFQYIHILIFGWLIYVALFNKKRIPGQCCSKTILVLMHLPLLSVYSCNVINGQSVGLSLIVYRMH